MLYLVTKEPTLQVSVSNLSLKTPWEIEIITLLPGQFTFVLHVLLSLASPSLRCWHVRPLYFGVGLVHVRERDWNPIPHDVLHVLHVPHEE